MHEPGWQQNSQQQHPNQERKRLDLKDIPPLITAIAALITALIGGAAFFAGRASSPSVPSPVATVTVTASASGSGIGSAPESSDTSSPTSSEGGAQPVIRYGPGLIHVDSVQLDTIPPQSGAGGGGDIGFSDQNSDTAIFGILSTKVALWTGSGSPDASQCASQVERLGVAGIGGAVSVQKGTIVCVVSDEGRTARIQVTDATSADAAAGFVLANVTVWQST